MDNKKLNRIQKINEILKILIYISLGIFILGVFFLDLDFIHYANYQNLLINGKPLMDITLPLILIDLLIGLLVLLIYQILDSIYEKMFWKIKYPLYEEEIKHKYNLKDRLFLDVESKIEFEKIRPKKTDTQFFGFYFLTVILLFFLNLFLAAIYPSNEKLILAFLIILQFINFLIIGFSILCFIISFNDNIQKKIREIKIIEKLVHIGKVTFLPHLLFYLFCWLSIQSLFDSSSSFTIINVFWFTILFFFWTFFTYVILLVFSLIRQGIGKKIRKKIMDSDYQITKQLFRVYRNISSILDLEASKEIIFEKYTDNMQNAILSNPLTKRYAIVLSKGFFNSLLNYFDNSHHYKKLEDWLSMQKPVDNDEECYIVNIIYSTFQFYLDGKKAYTENEFEKASNLYEQAINEWNGIKHKDIRKFNLHFQIRKKFSDMKITEDPEEITNIYIEIASLFIDISENIWYYDIWPLIQGWHYLVLYKVRIYRKGQSFDEMVDLKSNLEKYEEFNEYDEFSKLFNLQKSFILAIEKYAKSHSDKDEHIAEKDRLLEKAKEYLYESEEYIEEVNQILRESHTSIDTYEEIFDSFCKNERIPKLQIIIASNKLPTWFGIYIAVASILLIGIGSDVYAENLSYLFDFFSSRSFMICFSVYLVLHILFVVIYPIIWNKKKLKNNYE